MRRFIREHRRAFAIIIAYSVCAHILLAVNDIPFMDGWTYHVLIDKGDYESVLNAWRDNGRILIGIIYLWIGQHFGTIASYKISDIAAITLSGLLFYSLLVRETALGGFYSLMATLLGISYPAYEAHLALTTFTYITALPFFIAGIMALFEVDNGGSVAKRLGLRLLSHLLLLISYISEAYVVAGVAIPILIFARRKQYSYTLRSLINGYCKYLDIAIVAVAYMATMYLLMPVNGNYSHSRDISLSITSLIGTYVAYFTSALDFNILNITSYKFRREVNLALWLLLLVLGTTVYRYRFQVPQVRRVLCSAGMAFFMMGAIATPFVIAKRTASTFMFGTRHLTPVGFLAGLIIIAVVQFFVPGEPWRRRVTLTLVVMSFLTLSKDYVIWQSRGAFDHGVIENMRSHPELEHAPIVLVDKYRWFLNTVYGATEWEMMMREAYDNNTRWVFLTKPPLARDLWEQESVARQVSGNTQSVGFHDCQVVFHPIPSKESLRWYSGLQYLWLKLTASEEVRREWVKQRVSLSVEPVSGCKAPLS
jgi:hypothetical protein